MKLNTSKSGSGYKKTPTKTSNTFDGHLVEDMEGISHFRSQITQDDVS